MKRRSFIKKAIFGIVSLELGYLLFDAFKSKSSEKVKTNLFSAGKIAKFEKNKMYPYNLAKFYISVLEDGGLLAISIKCTHLGCMVQANADGFLCPCHASAFDKHGEVLSPPATRALDIFPISIQDGEILVDTNQAIKRDKFNKSQLTYV